VTGASSPSLELLYEAPGLPADPLPETLAQAYGGTLGFASTCLFANFVATADGVVAIPSIPGSNKLIADASATDRFVMGLLRACADVILVGSGTMTASPKSIWSPEQGYPPIAAELAELRKALGLPVELPVAVLSASGLVDPDHPVFAAGGLLITTDRGAVAVADRLPATAVVASTGAADELDVATAVAILHDGGHRRILSEGGPNVIGSLLAAGLVDELFLTISPLLVGRTPGDGRLALVEGADLLPDLTRGRLLGVRRDADHLFLRYALSATTAASAAP
jgi:riboflavin biosynthesis pyrimidine reductase